MNINMLQTDYRKYTTILKIVLKISSQNTNKRNEKYVELILLTALQI